jgi:hypothetical protein
MTLANIVLQVAPDNVVAPWELPPWYWVITAVVEFAMIILVVLWARSGREKREKKVPMDRAAENFANTTQAAYGNIPTFIYILWFTILLWIGSYLVLSIITGVQY